MTNRIPFSHSVRVSYIYSKDSLKVLFVFLATIRCCDLESYNYQMTHSFCPPPKICSVLLMSRSVSALQSKSPKFVAVVVVSSASAKGIDAVGLFRSWTHCPRCCCCCCCCSWSLILPWKLVVSDMLDDLGLVLYCFCCCCWWCWRAEAFLLTLPDPNL